MENKIDPYKIKNVNFSLIDEDDDRFEDFKKQRLERGFDSSELWSLDCTIAEFIAPRLRAFRENSGDSPIGKSRTEWEQILDEMIEGFELYPNHFNWPADESNQNWSKVYKALEHFRKYFFQLWY